MSLTLAATRNMNGFVRANLINAYYGMGLISETTPGHETDCDTESVIMTQTFTAGQKALRDLGHDADHEDVVITLDDVYHVLRPLDDVPEVFVHVVLNRQAAHLDEARGQLATISRDVSHEMLI
jgi:hypothetical protein